LTYHQRKNTVEEINASQKANAYQNMKLLIYFFIIALVACVQAETFVSNVASNTLVIQTNQVIFVSTARIANAGNYTKLPFLFVSHGRTNILGFPAPASGFDQGWNYFQRNVFVFAGPAELQFKDPATPSTPISAVVTFKRLASGNVFTAPYDPTAGYSNLVIDIPAGQTLHLCAPLFQGPPVFTLTAGSNTVQNIIIVGGEEFDGPANLTYSGTASGNGLISYYFTDDFLALPEVGAIQASAGNHFLTIEKSPDLKKWTPAFVQPEYSDQHSFYRFNLSR
jgi:hypothetical protein